MVNVTENNFVEQSNDLLDHLPTAAFIAIDEEMTGISVQGFERPKKNESPSQRYPILKQAPERYSIIQLGVCLFHSANDQGLDWRVRRYNFYMFPNQSPRVNNNMNHQPREVVLNPSTVAFLNQHNMNFDMWMKKGITYQNAAQAGETVDYYIAQQKTELEQEAQAGSEHATVQETVRRRVELRRTEDVEFYARTMARLREWLDAAHPPAGNQDFDADVSIAEAQGKCFLLPACNSFMRRAFYESIGKEYPSLELENAGPQFPGQIRVWRLTAAEKEVRRHRLRRDAWNTLIRQKVGMWRIFEALSRVSRGEELDRSSVLFARSYDDINWDAPGEVLDIDIQSQGCGRKIPLVVHNGFMDVCFLLTHFHENKLPESLQDCKSVIRSYFPTIYDTKVVASECTSQFNNDMTTLSQLFRKCIENDFLNRVRVVTAFNGNSVSLVDSGNGNNTTDQEHEAAYDAFMTGCVYIRLCNHIKETQDASSNLPDGLVGSLTHLVDRNDECIDQVQTLYGRNRLYQLSMYTMDLENTAEDPLSRGMLPESTYRVEGIDPSVSTRDIVRCLSGLFDHTGRRINFEIVWVDDTTFLVAASYRAPPIQRPASPAEEGEVSDERAEVAGRPVVEDNSAEVLKEHGQLIFNQLRGRFQTESIMTLDEHWKLMGNAGKGEEPSFLSRVLSIFRLGRKRKVDGEGEQSAAKRRRTS